MDFNLAQVNIARARYAFDDSRMSGITRRIAEINALAELAPGFVWRFQSEDGAENNLNLFADYFTPFARERFFYNMSVWQDLESLRGYVYRSEHRELLKRKDEWMEPFERPGIALWWIAGGAIPTVEESLAKLRLVEQHGSTAEAFTLAKLFPKPQRA